MNRFKNYLVNYLNTLKNSIIPKQYESITKKYKTLDKLITTYARNNPYVINQLTQEVSGVADNTTQPAVIVTHLEYLKLYQNMDMNEITEKFNNIDALIKLQHLDKIPNIEHKLIHFNSLLNKHVYNGYTSPITLDSTSYYDVSRLFEDCNENVVKTDTYIPLMPDSYDKIRFINRLDLFDYLNKYNNDDADYAYHVWLIILILTNYYVPYTSFTHINSNTLVHYSSIIEEIMTSPKNDNQYINYFRKYLAITLKELHHLLKSFNDTHGCVNIYNTPDDIRWLLIMFNHISPSLDFYNFTKIRQIREITCEWDKSRETSWYITKKLCLGMNSNYCIIIDCNNLYDIHQIIVNTLKDTINLNKVMVRLCSYDDNVYYAHWFYPRLNDIIVSNPVTIGSDSIFLNSRSNYDEIPVNCIDNLSTINVDTSKGAWYYDFIIGVDNYTRKFSYVIRSMPHNSYKQIIHFSIRPQES